MKMELLWEAGYKIKNKLIIAKEDIKYQKSKLDY